MDQWEQRTIDEADRVNSLRYDTPMTGQWIDVGSQLPAEYQMVLVAWLDIDGETRAEDVQIRVHEAEYSEGYFNCVGTQPRLAAHVLMWAAIPVPPEEALWNIEYRKNTLFQAGIITAPNISDGIPF